VKFKFYSNENIEWMTLNAIWIALNSNWIEVDWMQILKVDSNSIGFKINWKEMGCKLVYKILKIFLCLWCCKNILWKYVDSKRHLSIWISNESVKHIPIWNCL